MLFSRQSPHGNARVLLFLMTSGRSSIFVRIRRGVADFFVSWWREATRPISRYRHRTRFKGVLRRVMLWLPVAVLLAAILGAAGFYFFTGWRARDLAAKAMANALAGNLQMARLQVISARNLRAGDPAVKRTMIYVQSRLNDSGALPLWEDFAADGSPTGDELKEWARVAMLFGTDEQFARANDALAQAGLDADAAPLRSSRHLRQGNLAQSIAEARAAVEQYGGGDKKLDLLRLLLARHVPMLDAPGASDPSELKGREEVVALVDELQGTPQANEAIAMVLGSLPLPADKARAWAAAAMGDRAPTNPALLPAAQVMVAAGERTPQECLAMLSPAFDGADHDQRALFALWLNRQQMWDEVLSRITGKDAASHALCFEERGRALAGCGQWKELLSMSESPTQAPESLRCIFRGLAAGKLGRIGIAPKSLADAVRAGAREGRLPQTLAALDALGEQKIADPILIEMCASPRQTDAIFRLARDRFGRRGQFADLSAALDAAVQAAPDAPSVRDLRWRRELLAGKTVDTKETAAAADAAPADPQRRLTHALAMLKAGRPAEALGVFHNIDIFVDQLPPGDQAIVIALLEANGLDGLAGNVRQSLHPDLLQEGEYSLISPRIR